MAEAAQRSDLHEIIQSLEEIKNKFGPRFRSKGKNLYFRYFTNETLPRTVHVQVRLEREMPVAIGMEIHSQRTLDNLAACLDELFQSLEG